MGTVIGQKVADTTKTTCIEITAESYKCIDISAFVPQCITITSNVPTSEQYQEQYDRDPVEVTEAPQLQIALINNEAPVLNVNLDANGVCYVTDFDVVYINITNWNANAEYVNIFSNEDGNAAVIFLDEVEQRIVWALDDYALDGTQMWLNAQAKESEKLISPQSSVTVMQMEQTDQPNLSSWVSATEQTVINITILDYDATYTYSDPIVTGGTAVRTDNIIAWTLPDVTSDTYHEISITATAPLMYESLADVSGGSVIAIYYPVFTEKKTSTFYSGTRNVTISGVGFTAPVTYDTFASDLIVHGVFQFDRYVTVPNYFQAGIFLDVGYNYPDSSYFTSISGILYCNNVYHSIPVTYFDEASGYTNLDIVFNCDGTYTYTIS